MTTQLPKYNITDMQTRYKVVEALISENFWNENTINRRIRKARCRRRNKIIFRKN